MAKAATHLPILLLTLTSITVVRAQYYDILQGLQQLFQPYPAQNDFFPQFNTNHQTQLHRQEHKKKTENQYGIKIQPVQQYDYGFSTTTPKPSRKTPKPNSSHTNKQSSNRNYNTDLIFSDYVTPTYDVTTRRHRVKPSSRRTTTVRPNKQTTENIFAINYNKRPVETAYEPNNNRDVYSVNNYENHSNLQQNTRPSSPSNDYSSNFNAVTSNRNPNVQNINLNTHNTVPNNGFSNDFSIPTNTRNPDVTSISNNRVPQNHRNNNFGSQTNGFTNNRGNNNNNNRGTLNTDYGNNNRGNIYPNNPLINRPGVKPVVVDPNQAPITNKPLVDKNNYVPYNRPDDGHTPEILIGPDEDDMTEEQKRRYINIAERMCDRYKNLNVKEVVALPLLPSPDPVEVNVSSCVPITVPLVIGGKIASINEFPHMALVGWKKIAGHGYSWKCGGSLISNLYILSAGHCTYQDRDYDVDSGPPQAVQLGSSYLDDPKALVVKIAAVIRHPKYKQRRSYYDIALIKMAHPVTQINPQKAWSPYKDTKLCFVPDCKNSVILKRFSEVIRPACLGVPPPVGDSIIATGWGRTEFGGDHSVELRSVSLPIWNMAECREIWGTSLKLPNGPIPDSHMCAGEKLGGKDTCQGDSGGPAQVQDGCVWRVVAVTSFGRSCGAPNTPALYAITKRAFIAAQVFADYDQDSRSVESPAFDRTPTTYNTQVFNTRQQPRWQ